ncbi:EAL and GGDEF domain-containing protein [Marinobacterium sp. D7]|uniref:bifunctional diguanylate cyclase/phosphodiesterase n=1 Tax=Marinobacterium ramblicola TaxID=2849041 RepID=UPI001C2CC702|nr:bifunctional diguanylate cyclase/phosphodiesterase [Marinobacterium ramblicola]MBV1788952.1 EAL and GGDEF domain-containing protein [Marinobacterium ramblicola]
MGVERQFAQVIESELDELELLTEIIQQECLFPVFQPIVDLSTGECLGHEALIRGPSGTPLHAPYRLFNAAIRHHLLHRLELLCRRRSIECFAAQTMSGKLFLNVSASLLSSSDYQHGFTIELLQALGIPQENIVIELSEQHPFDNHGLTRSAVDHYRQMGFRIAIDDLGSGYSGLKLWADLQPDYVKIDMHFVRTIDRDSVKREFVRSICNIGRTLHCNIIAEGIETLEELHTLQEMGVRYGQGFLLGRPLEEPVMSLDPLTIRHGYLQSRGGERGSAESDTARALVRGIPAVSPEDRLLEVSEIFRTLPDVGSVPVLVDGEPVGVVRRSDLLELFSAQYGRALYEQKPVSRLMREDALVVPSDLPLERVSQMITEQDAAELVHQELIIVQDGCYLGMASLRDLLKRITELKIRNARYSNPLTLLPGNVPINREIDALLNHATDFHIAYFDLNHFKPFNDCYGYSRGDQVIRLLGMLLTNNTSSDVDFVGHIGGDDFVVLFRSRQWRSICEQVIEQFGQRVRELYRANDLAAGGIWSVDRNGERCFQPLLTLAVGVVHPDPYKCSSYHEVAELAADAKKCAKQQGGDSIYLSPQRHLSQLWRSGVQVSA